MSLVPDYFYPFGPSAGDTTDPTADDSYTGPHHLAQSITYFGDEYSSLYVSVAFRFVSSVNYSDICTFKHFTDITNHQYFYRPPSKLRKGIVFSRDTMDFSMQGTSLKTRSPDLTDWLKMKKSSLSWVCSRKL